MYAYTSSEGKILLSSMMIWYLRSCLGNESSFKTTTESHFSDLKMNLLLLKT